MFYFDLSTTNIILIAAVMALVVVFLLIFRKLKPSTKPRKKAEDEKNPEIPEQGQPRISLPLSEEPSGKPSSQSQVEKSTVLVDASNAGASLQTEQEPGEAPVTLDQNGMIPMYEGTVASPAPTQASIPASGKDCAHSFGYLRTFRKSTPIPDECLVCERIVNCLANDKKQTEQ